MLTEAGTKRLRAIITETLLADVGPEEAARLLAKDADYLDVIEAVQRFRRIAAHDYEHIEAEVAIEDASEDWIGPYGVTPVYGDGREKYLWSARHFVIQARNELSRGRYREGICPELDAVNRDLAMIEDRLRLMAWAVDHPEDGDADPA